MFDNKVADLTQDYNISKKSKWFTLIVTCLGALLLNIDLFIVNVALAIIVTSCSLF